jgi:tryptophan-rich sensory protein
MTFVDHAPDRGHGRYGMLVAFLALTLGVGAVSGIATAADIDGWYRTLARPDFTPPNWVFGPVWTILYVLMGVAAWRVWRIAGTRSRPMLLFAIQLALNCAWSFIFFRAHALVAATAEILVLLAFVIWTGLSFARRDRIAGFLFLPYGLWVGFAALLTASIQGLNGG